MTKNDVKMLTMLIEKLRREFELDEQDMDACALVINIVNSIEIEDSAPPLPTTTFTF